MTLSAKIEGVAKVLEALAKAGENYIDALDAAVYEKGQMILGDAKTLCPVDTGRLRATGYCAPPTDQGGPTQIGFGTDYALAVHEKIEIPHKVGEAKFLEKAVNMNTADYRDWLAKRTVENYAAGVKLGSVPATEPTTPAE